MHQNDIGRSLCEKEIGLVIYTKAQMYETMAGHIISSMIQYLQGSYKHMTIMEIERYLKEAHDIDINEVAGDYDD
jgi:hypothetical protein